jgi:hypothetical protein
MLADGMIAARIRSTVELDGVSQMLEKLHNGGLRGKAVIRLRVSPLQCPFWARLSGRADKKDPTQAESIGGFGSRGHEATNGDVSLQARVSARVYLP